MPEYSKHRFDHSNWHGCRRRRTFRLSCLVQVVPQLLMAAVMVNPVRAETEPTTAPAAATRSLVVVESKMLVKRYDVQGNSQFKTAEIDAILAPFTGEIGNLAELRNAALALQAAYHKAGYLITQVVLPEQEVEDGVIILKVIEGRLAEVSVTGNQRLERNTILNSLPVLETGKALDLHQLHAGLLLANENPSRRLAVNFRPDKTPGEVIAQVRVQEADAHKFMATLNDTGSDSTGNLRLSLAWQNTNVMQKDHVSTLQYTLAPDDLSAVSVFGGGYRIPFYRQGFMLDLVAAYSDVSSGSVGTPSGTLDFTGRGRVIGAQFTRLMPTLLNVQQRLSLSLYQRQYRNECTIDSTAGTCGGSGEDVTTQPLAISYSGQWHRPGSQIGYSLSASANIPGGNNGSSADFDLASGRRGADNRYLIWRMDANLNQQLPKDWQLRASIEGQWINEALVSGEQFGIGGVDSVRGFDERGVTGERGWRAGIDYRRRSGHPHTPRHYP